MVFAIECYPVNVLQLVLFCCHSVVLWCHTSEKDATINLAQSAAGKASEDASAASERAEDLQQKLNTIATEASTAAREHAAYAEGLQEEIQRLTAEASIAEERGVRVQELHHELETTRQLAAAAAAESAALIEKVRQEMEAATVTTSSTTEENEALHKELANANAKATNAASAFEESAAHVEGLRRDLEKANAALLAAQSDAISEQELERAKLALSEAQDGLVRSNEMRVAAEVNAKTAEEARRDMQAELEALRHELAARDAPVGAVPWGSVNDDGTSNLTEYDAVAATRALQEAKEDALQAEARLTAANQTLGETQRQAASLRDEVCGLEAHLVEARASSTRLDIVIKEQREALQSSSVKVNYLEERLAAAQSELDGEKTYTVYDTR